MRELVVDLEADGLKPTVIHVAIVKDLADGKHYEFYKDDAAAFSSMVRDSKLIFHNGIGFDLPVLRKLLTIVYERSCLSIFYCVSLLHIHSMSPLRIYVTLVYLGIHDSSAVS